jgi:hypothetical protein
MLRSFILAVVVGSFASTAVLAQSSAAAASQTVSDKTPFENSKAGAADARGPGSWVDRARARHNTLITQRVRGDGSGSGLASPGSSSSGGSSTNLLSGLTDLINLASQAGISLGGSTLGGASSTTIPNSGSSGTTSSGGVSAADIEAAGATDAFNQLLQLQSGLTSQARQDPLDAEFDDMGFPKSDQRSQTQTPTTPEEEDSFQIRLVDSWLSTIFTAVTLGFQSRDFIDMLADNLRPILRPDLVQPTDNTGGDGNTGDNTGTGGSLDDLGTGSRV